MFNSLYNGNGSSFENVNINPLMAWEKIAWENAYKIDGRFSSIFIKSPTSITLGIFGL